LTILQLSGNGISDVSPIAGLVQLRTLDLSSNRISDLTPLAGLVNLKVLNLAVNPLQDLTSLINLDELHEVSLRSVPGLTCEQIGGVISTFGNSIVKTDLVCPEPVE
jgi:internalin A